MANKSENTKINTEPKKRKNGYTISINFSEAEEKFFKEKYNTATDKDFKVKVKNRILDRDDVLLEKIESFGNIPLETNRKLNSLNYDINKSVDELTNLYKTFINSIKNIETTTNVIKSDNEDIKTNQSSQAELITILANLAIGNSEKIEKLIAIIAKDRNIDLDDLDIDSSNGSTSFRTPSINNHRNDATHTPSGHRIAKSKG